MSSLRKRLKDPRVLLGLWVVFVAGCVLDTFRAPGSQCTGKAYIGVVHVYQALGRPIIKQHIHCRYHPTCSEYSIEAVEKHGIRWGLVLTYRRINSCQPEVPLGTEDPVPPPDSP